MVGQIVAGVGEFEFNVLKEFFRVVVGQVFKMSFGEFFGVAAATFGFVEGPEGIELNENAEALWERQGAALLNFAIGFA